MTIETTFTMEGQNSAVVVNSTTGQSTAFTVPPQGGTMVTTADNGAATVTVTSAAPGTVRAIWGKISETAATMTSGNIVGVRGEADLVSASGGFVYGAQGKIIPTGTLSGSLWAAPVFGQFDIHSAIVNGAQLAAIWGDWGATGATPTSMVGCRGFAFTNTTSNILNAQIYLYGGATNLFELDDNSGGVGATYITSGGSGTIGGTLKKLAFTINGTTYYLLAGTSIT